jgi:CheY-like chemotaxis protein
MAHPPQPLRVLVVDDDAMVRELLAVMLEAEGYAVQCAESGDAALAQLRPPPPAPEVILADIQMPGTTGAQLARKLRATCGPATLLLAMSGSGPSPKSIALYDGFLLKPFTTAQFAAALSARKNGLHPAPATPRTTRKKLRQPFTQGSPIPAAGISIFASSSQTASNNRMGARPQSAKSAASTRAILGNAPPGTPVLNEKIYAQLATSMPPAQLREMYTMCLSDARQRIAAMRTLASAGDRLRFSREAHSIKGGSGMLGATEIYTLAAQLEAETRDSPQIGPFSTVNSLDDLTAACDRLERILGARA